MNKPWVSLKNLQPDHPGCWKNVRSSEIVTNREGESLPQRGLSFTQGQRESCAHLLSPRSWCPSSYSKRTASSCSADRPPAPGSKKNSLRPAWDLLQFSHQLTVSDFKKRPRKTEYCYKYFPWARSVLTYMLPSPPCHTQTWPSRS